MTTFPVTILGIITFHLISGTPARPENFNLSEKQIRKLRDIATQWSEVINFETKPCEDFYDFMCSSQEYSKTERKKFQDISKDILDAKTELITETERKYFNYFTTCGALKEEETKEFIQWFKFENSIGSWPAFVENWNDSKFNLPLAIAELNSYGYPVVFAQELIFDTENKIEPTLKIYTQDLMDIENEKEVLKSTFEKLGIKNPDDLLTDAVLFEKTFKEATESVKSATNKRITFSELRSFLPEVDWDKQIEIIYDGKLPDNFAVLMKNHEELKKIYKAISKLSPKIISNYFFCFIVYTLDGQIYSQTLRLFMPAIKQAFLKHFYDQNTKELLKGMYVTILEILQDKSIPQNNKTHFSAEQVAKFIDEKLFGLANEEDLANEFKEVSTTSNECAKNYHRLQKLYKKRLAKHFLNYESNFVNIIESDIAFNLFYDIPTYVEDPSPSLFLHVTLSVIAITFKSIQNLTVYPSETINCFSKQFAEELIPDNIEEISAVQLVLKTLEEWTKNYPKIVQEENKILKEYNLTAEKLLILLITKYSCKYKEPFKMLTVAFANSPEFSQIFDCPLGSKMNAAPKCNFW